MKRTQTDVIVMKPFQRSIGTMTDFCKKPTLKSSSTITDDVAQKSVETMADVAGENIRCHEETKKTWARTTVQKMRMKIDFHQLMSPMMTVEIQFVNCKHNGHIHGFHVSSYNLNSVYKKTVSLT